VTCAGAVWWHRAAPAVMGCGAARLGWARHGTARRGAAWQEHGEERGWAWHGSAGLGWARRGRAGQGMGDTSRGRLMRDHRCQGAR